MKHTLLMAIMSLPPLVLWTGTEKSHTACCSRQELDSGIGFMNTWSGIKGRTNRVLLRHQTLTKRFDPCDLSDSS